MQSLEEGVKSSWRPSGQVGLSGAEALWRQRMPSSTGQPQGSVGYSSIYRMLKMNIKLNIGKKEKSFML